MFLSSLAGKGAGSLIGGYMMTAFGTRPTYRVFAVACTFTGFLYFLFNQFYLRKRPQVRNPVSFFTSQFGSLLGPIAPVLH
jgi:hypothetical protein